MPIEFNCEYCQQMIRVPEESVGHQARCPFCQNVQPVPASSDLSSTPLAGNPPPPPPSSSDWSTSPPTMGTSSPPGSSNFEPSSTASNPYRDPPANPYASSSALPASSGGDFAQQWNLATVGDRLLGAVIDYLFLLVAMAPGLAVATMASNNANQTMEQVAAVLCLIGMVAFVATQCVLISSRAQSVGKIVMKTRIVTLSGAAPGFVHGVLLRSWAFGLIIAFSSILCFCLPISPVVLLVDALLIFGERRQCLHDMLASTYVVSDKVN